VKKASEYRQHADECRALAAQMQQGDQRDQLMRMAETWENLAKDRERLSRKSRELNEKSPAGKPDPERR
jgi:chromosome segregation ATPase